jgi:hypothetical protein
MDEHMSTQEAAWLSGEGESPQPAAAPAAASAAATAAAPAVATAASPAASPPRRPARIETFSLIIWAKARNEEPEAQAQRAYRVLSLLDANGRFAPRYQKAKSKKAAPLFEVTQEAVAKAIEKGRDKKFPHLGSSLGFFSNMDDAQMSGVSMITGVTDPGFINNVVLNISRSYPWDDPRSYETVAALFKDLVCAYEPFFATLASHANSDLYGDGGYASSSTGMPNAVFWLNFWGREAAARLRMDIRAKDLASMAFEVAPMLDGYFVRLRERPFFVGDEDALALQRRAGMLLGL